MRRVPPLLRNAVIALLALAALALYFRGIQPYTRNPAQDFDAVHLYFPLARDLLSRGLAFFADERSVQAPPLSYIWPALLGPDLDRLRIANALLSGATLLLVFRTAQLAHSSVAGIIAAFLFAASPLLRPYLAAPITEPPYIFLAAVWAWSFLEWIAGKRPAYLAVSAIAIVLAALTRATMFYGILGLVVVFAGLSVAGPDKQASRRALAIYLVALVLPAALIAKNLAFFGLPFYTTGGGNALYLGNNPVTGGYDPNYLGLMYDVGSIARDQSHLTVEAERLLGGTARFMIAEQERGQLALMHLKKLAAFLFVTSAEPGSGALRSWRIALLLFSALGAFAIRWPAMRWALVGMLLYQVAVHVPVLYTHRYSVGAIDLWLMLLASAGAASLVSLRRWVPALVFVAAAAGCVLYGRWLYKHDGPPQPDVFRAARIEMWQGAKTAYRADPVSGPLDIAVAHRSLPFDRALNYVLVLDVSAPNAPQAAGCTGLVVAYRREGDADFGRAVERDIRGAGAHRIQVGSSHIGLHADGVLRLHMRCKAATTLTFERMAIYAAVGSIDFRERWLGEKPLFPGLMER